MQRGEERKARARFGTAVSEPSRERPQREDPPRTSINQRPLPGARRAPRDRLRLTGQAAGTPWGALTWEGPSCHTTIITLPRIPSGGTGVSHVVPPQSHHLLSHGRCPVLRDGPFSRHTWEQCTSPDGQGDSGSPSGTRRPLNSAKCPPNQQAHRGTMQ
ncbi:hypothetical protein AAFF_G00011790 [Aldrovandia affinis]|uniref:Uncharacterized protein n=1 Tax=Aldrovandia affinis TaxID=143900 RepID=A0AAD7S6G7_9TELE|nr:hypothetical protein AAFF_G00011790 [Aldrovandia affinis]